MKKKLIIIITIFIIMVSIVGIYLIVNIKDELPKPELSSGQRETKEKNKKIKKIVGLKKKKKIVTCMVIGYPSVKYQRTVPRNEAKVTWK